MFGKLMNKSETKQPKIIICNRPYAPILVSFIKIDASCEERGKTLLSHSVLIMGIIARDFRGAIAIAVQKRNAMTMIAGRCLAIGRAATCAAA